MAYFDNNATTHMNKETIAEFVRWTNRGNASSSYAAAGESRAMMKRLRQRIAAMSGGFTICERDLDESAEDSARPLRPGSYKIIFTSGASESNCTFIQSAIDAYTYSTHRKPHIIASEIEHKSILLLLHRLEERQEITLTLVKPSVSGHIQVADVVAAINPSTILAVIMHANNETGAINDIEAIGSAMHTRKVLFYTDTAQSFGKVPIDATKMNIDGFPISFHKLHGPPGVGALVLRSELVYGWKLGPLVCGTQNYGYRGGTENLPGLGAALKACEIYAAARNDATIAAHRTSILRAMPVPVFSYAKYAGRSIDSAEGLVILTLTPAKALVSTLMISVVLLGAPLDSKPICNARLKSALEAEGVIVSIGSACNTSSVKASHVLAALGADAHVRAGALRISLSRDTTAPDVTRFSAAFEKVLRNLYGKYMGKK